MARRVTLKDVAADVGVSVMTVSNAFNRPDQLSHDLRERVLGRARALGYMGPDPLGRGLRRGHAGAIGVVSDTPLSYAFDDAAAASVLAGVCAVAERAGLGLLLVPPGGAGPVDGVIVYSVGRDEPLLELTRQAPAVVIDQPRATTLPTVGIDDEAAAREAAGHLRALGHERIAVVAFARGPHDVTDARLAGYGDLPVIAAGNSREAGRAAARRLPAVTAVLATSDQLALGVLDVAPELSVIGFDDIPEAAAAGLTTIRQDHRAKGERAAELLLSGRRENVELPYELVIRRSARAPSA